MISLKRLQRRQAAMSTVHRLLQVEERMVARQLAQCRNKEMQEQTKLNSLQAYYAEYIQNMRDAQTNQTAQVQDRIRQQQFLTRLQTIIERQQGEVDAISRHTANAVDIWAKASRRANNMSEQLEKASRIVARERLLASERQTEEEAQQRRLFLSHA